MRTILFKLMAWIIIMTIIYLIGLFITFSYTWFWDNCVTRIIVSLICIPITIGVIVSEDFDYL